MDHAARVDAEEMKVMSQLQHGKAEGQHVTTRTYDARNFAITQINDGPLVIQTDQDDTFEVPVRQLSALIEGLQWFASAVVTWEVGSERD